MENQPMSPILSIKKSKQSTEASVSPVLSNARKRKREHLSTSPVLARSSSSRSYHLKAGDKSPVIENVSSPPGGIDVSLNYGRLQPKSLLFSENDEILPDVVYSQPSPQTSESTNEIEEDMVSDNSECEDEVVIHEKTLSDAEDSMSSDARASCRSRSDTSYSISQTCSLSSVLHTTPEKRVMKQSQCITTGSARKKKQYLPNGLAKQLSKLLVRQDSDYRLWRFQQKTQLSTSFSSADCQTTKCLRLRIESVSTDSLHHRFAHCLAESGHERCDVATDRVSLVFTVDRWERFGVRAGDIVTIYEPWYSSMPMGGVTLLLSFNLLRKEVVSKLSNATNDSITCDGACSSASADNINVAENRCPSSVTVLQTWSCPCQDCPCNFHPSMAS